MVIGLLRSTAAKVLRLSKAVGHLVLVRASTSLSLQSILLICNICFFYAGVKKLRRARFAAAVRLLADMDEEGLKTVVRFLPAWVKFSDYERAKFLNDAAQMLWPAFDTALCSLIKSELEPHMRYHSPAVIGGLSFERLSFGHLPLSILGVRHVPSWNADNLGIDLDLDVRWAGQPDAILRLTPSRRWMTHALKIGKLKVFPQMDMTPVMNAQLHAVHIACVLRVTLAPILDNLPFVGAVGLSILDQPYLDFDLRLVSGTDIMSIPALATWLRSSMMDLIVGNMQWPKRVDIPILHQDDADGWINPPIGILQLQVLQAELPERVSRMRRQHKPLNPYIVMAIGPEGKQADSDDERKPSAEVHTKTQDDTTTPAWHRRYSMCLQDAAHALRVIAVHDAHRADHASDVLLGRVDIPLGSLVREHGRQGDKFAEVTKAALNLRRAVTKALSDEDNDDVSTVYASPQQSLRVSSGDEGTGLSGSGCGLASLLHPDPPTHAASPRIIRSPHNSIKQPDSQQPPSERQPLPSHAEGQHAARTSSGEESDSSDGHELSREEQEERDRAEKQRAKDRAKRRWQNARPMHKKAVPARSMQHRTAHEAALACAEEGGAWLPLLPIKSFWGGAAAAADPEEAEGQPRSESFFPTLPVLGSLMGGAASAATGIGSLFRSSAPSHSSESDVHVPSSSAPDRPPKRKEKRLPPWKTPSASFVEPAVSAPDAAQKQGLSSFFDWHHASKRTLQAAATEGKASQQDSVQPASPVAHLMQQMSLDLGDHDADTSSDETDSTAGASMAAPQEAEASQAETAAAAPRKLPSKQRKSREGGRRGFAQLFGLKLSAEAAEAAAEQLQPDAAKPDAGPSRAAEGAAARQLHEKHAGVLGAVRLQLRFCPISRTPQAAALHTSDDDSEQDARHAASGEAASSTQSEAAFPHEQAPHDASDNAKQGQEQSGKAQQHSRHSRSPFEKAVPRQPPPLGALIALLQTCNLTEAKLQAPSARLRLGDSSQQTPLPEGAASSSSSPVARAEWNFRACFALHLPCQHEHLLVEVGDAVRGTKLQVWSHWKLPHDYDAHLSNAGLTPWGAARIRIAEVLSQGQMEGSWKLWRAHDSTGAPEQCGQVSLKLAWLPCI